MKQLRFSAAILIVLLSIPSCADRPAPPPEFMSGSYWKDQALKDILPPWTKYSRDTASGAFHTNLDSVWMPFGSSDKYPSMISRHLFSYSAAYLLSGEEENISIADSTVRWLIDKAWDREYGGWFDALDKDGLPVQTTKTTFVQVYAITGLALYYFVTHDTTVLGYIERSNDLLETKAWDNATGGYYDVMNRDWSVNNDKKSFSSEITPVSGYLVYLYLATRDKKYLDQIGRVLRVTMDKMTDSETGWILEDFDRSWNYLPVRHGASEINTGHNIEAAWMLLKDFLLSGNREHLDMAMMLTNKIHQHGVFNKNSVWLATTARIPLSDHSSETYWWIQAYGNMYSLYLYHITGEVKYLRDFQRGALVWHSGFIDRKYGDTFMSVDSAVQSLDATKANRFKTSYHSIEHCLLNYLCLNLWVNYEPVEFHFRINSSKDGDILYPVLLEDSNIKITGVVPEDIDEALYIIDNQSIRLPELNKYPLKVIMLSPVK